MNITKIENILRDYRQRKQKIDILRCELTYLENNSFVNASKFTDETSTKSKTLDERYQIQMSKKTDIMKEIFLEELQIQSIDKAMELLRVTHRVECQIIEMYYIQNMTQLHISLELGYCEKQIGRKRKSGLNELAKLLQYSINAA